MAVGDLPEVIGVDRDAVPRLLIEADVVLIAARGDQGRAADAAGHTAAESAGSGRARKDEVLVVRRQEDPSVSASQNRVSAPDAIRETEPRWTRKSGN
ncbi:MAG TPA: hypothetical protein VLW55_18980 [Burkholderiaceae bacterium]|nr:hypothetical protein [Burkholderiaceae bacterium]